MTARDQPFDEPFKGSEAVASGVLRRHQLRSRFRAVLPDVYVQRDQQLTSRQRATAAWLWSHRKGVLAGVTAWHGSKWVDRYPGARGLRQLETALDLVDAGSQCRWQYTRDIRRREALDRLGWVVIRVIAADRKADIICRVRDALDFRASSLHRN